MAELIRCSGTQFDPACVEVFLGYLRSNFQAGVFLPT
jgi:HD-GYP domain-containing protein (c-di-GMP phosphodiesterase class II)